VKTDARAYQSDAPSQYKNDVQKADVAVAVNVPTFDLRQRHLAQSPGRHHVARLSRMTCRCQRGDCVRVEWYSCAVQHDVLDRVAQLLDTRGVRRDERQRPRHARRHGLHLGGVETKRAELSGRHQELRAAINHIHLAVALCQQGAVCRRVRDLLQGPSGQRLHVARRQTQPGEIVRIDAQEGAPEICDESGNVLALAKVVEELRARVADLEAKVSQRAERP